MTSSRLEKSAGSVLTALVVLSSLSGCASHRPAANAGKDGGSGSGFFPWYEVDPEWPQKPARFEWGHMPGIAVDADEVWIFTRTKPFVQVYGTDGKFVRAWEDLDVERAHHIRIGPEGHVWLSDAGAHVIHKCTRDGKILLTLGTPGETGDDESHFNEPTDMAITPSGDIFVSDGYENNRVVHFDREGRFVKSWGQLGTGPGEFHLPHAIAVDSRGRLYVADRTNQRIQVFEQDGTFVAEWPDLIVPWGIWITGDDDIWVCGSSPMPQKGDGVPCCPPKDQILMRFDGEGTLRQLWTVPKGTDGQEKPGELNWLHAMATDKDGNMYAGDIHGRRAQKFVLQRPDLR
ncbi:MAG: peptidyl-alpha-hydroxyglycine alpha-amidating lyase family protein [Planctomycetota bacterium]|nr:peptidyl-alpha-hydroxyglycine alpha-amidating lyase family protein [Planctomycetota bacterium]